MFVRIALTLLLFVVASGQPSATTPTASAPQLEHSLPRHTAEFFDPEHLALVSDATARLAAVGLELPPDLEISFPTDPARCGGYGGAYMLDDRSVRICRPSLRTVIHELAHVWTEASLDDEAKAEFLRLRGVENWFEGPDWGDRGAEQAAEILTWGLAEQDIALPWLETMADGTTSMTTRLLKFERSDAQQLAVAFRFLTGSDSPYRSIPRSSPVEIATVASPEAVRFWARTDGST